MAATAPVGGTAVITKVLLSVTAMLGWVAMTTIAVVVLIIVVVVCVVVYFLLKRRSNKKG